MALPSVNPERPALPGPTGRVGPRAPAVDIGAPLLWAAALLAASRLAALVEVLPVLGLLSGPLGVVLAVVAAAVAAARVLPRPRIPVRSAFAIAAAAWVFLAAVGLGYTMRLRVSGDEPHYLVMAQSLWREHDLDLRDNYEREDWREYTPGPVTP